MKKALLFALALLLLALCACARQPVDERPVQAALEQAHALGEDEKEPISEQAENAAEEPEATQIDEALLTDDALIQLVLEPEIALTRDNSFTFDDPTELSSQELYLLFLCFSDYETLEKECLNEATGEFIFTEDYISAALRRVFKDFSLDLTQVKGFDAARDAVMTKQASGFGGDRNPRLTEKKVDGAVVTFMVEYYAYDDFEQTALLYEKTYQVEFYGGGVYYLSAVLNQGSEAMEYVP